MLISMMSIDITDIICHLINLLTDDYVPIKKIREETSDSTVVVVQLDNLWRNK